MTKLKLFLTILFITMLVTQPLTVMALIMGEGIPIKSDSYDKKEVGWAPFGIPTGLSWDGLAIQIGKITIEAMVDSTIDWINGTPNRGPAFVENPAEFFGNIVNGVGGELISDSNLGFLCSPFHKSVQLSLSHNFRNPYSGNTPTQFQCTLTDIAGNAEDFLDGNFSSNGGWETWLTMTQNPSNNPYGSYLQAKISVDERLATLVGLEKEELSWGRGFLSTKDRVTGEIVTPGTLIEKQLGETLGSGIRQLELADEFDELIGALLGRLLSETVFNENGLFSNHTVSNGGGGNGNNAMRNLSCRASREYASVGDEVTWSASVASTLGSNVRYSWNGEGIEGATGSSVSVNYDIPDTKTAGVTASILNEDDEIVNTISVSCDGAVAVSAYQPLAVSCYPRLPTGRDKQPVEWNARVNGGSGALSVIRWNGDQTGGWPLTHSFGLSDSSVTYPDHTWQTEETGAQIWDTTMSATRDSSGISVILRRIYVPQGGTSNNKRANITIVDADPSVLPIVEQQCSPTVYVY